MKKNLFWMMLLVMVGGLAFVACSDDDDDNGTGNKSIVGIWADADNPYDVYAVKAKAGSTVPYGAGYYRKFFLFDGDGTMLDYTVYTDKNDKYVVGADYLEGTYTTNGNVLTYKLDGDKDDFSCYFSVEKKKSLTLSGGSWEDKYLWVDEDDFLALIGYDEK